MDLESMGIEEAGSSLQNFDAVLLEQSLDPAAELEDDLLFPSLGYRKIQARVLDENSHGRGFGDLRPEMAGFNERLGRNASALQAFASGQKLIINDGDFLPELSGADCGHIAAGSGAENGDFSGFCEITDDQSSLLN